MYLVCAAGKLINWPGHAGKLTHPKALKPYSPGRTPPSTQLAGWGVSLEGLPTYSAR